MAATVDTGNSPIRFTGTPALSAAITSASFTAPANSLLVACVQSDGATGGGFPTAQTVTDSGGLTWAKQVERSHAETTDGGASAIWTAIQLTSAARTVNFNTGASGTGGLRASANVYVVVGADVAGTPVDTVTASNEGSDTTNNSMTTTSVTPGASGLLFASDCEWNERGVFAASSDLTQDTADYVGAISVCNGYKPCTSGVGVTANLDAFGTGLPQHKWCTIIVREAFVAPSTSVTRTLHRPFSSKPGASRGRGRFS